MLDCAGATCTNAAGEATCCKAQAKCVTLSASRCASRSLIDAVALWRCNHLPLAISEVSVFCCLLSSLICSSCAEVACMCLSFNCRAEVLLRTAERSFTFAAVSWSSWKASIWGGNPIRFFTDDLAFRVPLHAPRIIAPKSAIMQSLVSSLSDALRRF